MVLQPLPERDALQAVRLRLREQGPERLSLTELLMLVTNLSLEQANSLQLNLTEPECDARVRLRRLCPLQARALPGLGPVRATALLAAVELGRRLFLEPPSHPAPLLDNPEVVWQQLRSLAFAEQEHFAVLLLDRKNRLVAQRVVSIGTLDETIAHPRDVFRDAVRVGAAGLIAAHNHPSGCGTASPEDLRLTEQLLACGRTLQIPVLDHVILTATGFTSLRRTTKLWADKRLR